MSASYRITNWSTYNHALVERGSLTLWLSPAAMAGWRAAAAGRVGAPTIYANLAIETILAIRQVFHLPLRATQGFVSSVFRLTATPLPVPNYTTLSRRTRRLPVGLRKKSKKNTIIIVDSSGLKVFGAGEWRTEKRGTVKAKTWKKIHIAIDGDGEIRAVDLTGNGVLDATQVPALLAQEAAPITTLIADGGYDQQSVYHHCQQRGISHVIIPPRRDAVLWAPDHPRTMTVQAIHHRGRHAWKATSGYHRRSVIESTMARLKGLLGERLRSREWSRQLTELRLRAAILNCFWHLGQPQAVPVP